MKIRGVVLIAWISLIGMAACSSQAADTNNITEESAGEAASAEPMAATATAELDTQAPTTTSLPTEIPTAAATPTPVPPPQWVWAWTQDPAQFVAVSTTGEVNVLADAPDPETLNNPSLWQIGPDKALAVYYADGQTSAILLTTSEAIGLPLPPLQLEVPENGWDVIARSDPYVVIRHFYSYAQPTFLINTETAEISLISNNVVDFDKAVTFSADNRYLRYVSTDTNSGTPSEVIERDLTSGDERTLYSYSNFDHVYSDATGDIWFDIRTGDLIAADGRPTNSQRDVRASIYRWLVGDTFLTGEYGCVQDCLLTLTPIFGSDPALTFTLPEKLENYGMAGWLLADQSLLAYDFGTRAFWHLRTDGSGDRVGYRDLAANYTFRSFNQRLIGIMDSADSETTSALLDTFSGEVVPLPTTVGTGEYLWTDRYPGGTLWSLYRDDNSLSIWLLPDGSDTFIAVPDAPANTFCDTVLPDGNLVCSQYDETVDGSNLLLLDMASGDLSSIFDQPVYFLARPVP